MIDGRELFDTIDEAFHEGYVKVTIETVDYNNGFTCLRHTGTLGQLALRQWGSIELFLRDRTVQWPRSENSPTPMLEDDDNLFVPAYKPAFIHYSRDGLEVIGNEYNFGWCQKATFSSPDESLV